MPQYNAPDLITQLIAGDLVLVWQTSSGANRTITGADLADSIKDLIDFNDTVSVVAASTLLSNEEFVVANSGAGFTISLPSSVANPGKVYTISNKGAAAVTIARTGTDFIGGTTSVALAQYHSNDFRSDGEGVWHQIGV
jgi:hypothetical protein